MPSSTLRFRGTSYCSRQVRYTNRWREKKFLNDMPTQTVIFTCEANLAILCGQDADVFAEFCKSVNSKYVIHACVNGRYMPLVFCLLSGKTKQRYLQRRGTIRDRCLSLGLNFTCKSANFYFETAAINASRTVCPTVSVCACRFHLGQAIRHHIQCLGPADEYKSSCRDIGCWLHLFHDLSFLHPDDVADAFAFDIMDCAPTSEYTNKFVLRMSKLQRFLLRFGLEFHLMYNERIMDQNNFSDIAVVNSYPLVLNVLL
jgi:hypothetical protein